jgi:hypothetical protein
LICNASSTDAYTALSYVWGKAGNIGDSASSLSAKLSSAGTAGLILPTILSKVIESAITVTKELDMRYRVDKYCIDQGNEAGKHDQISKMDTIYKRSAVIIIAAAGDDENYGLPGVGNELRCCRPSIQVGSTTLVFTHGHPSHSITTAKWSSRAWTYQEAVLSRRLVFTEEQVYFECDSMNCFESLNAPLRALHTKTGKRSGALCVPVYLREGMRIIASAVPKASVESFLRFSHILSSILSDALLSTQILSMLFPVF